MTNIVIETGRLTADPELRYTGETPLCKFRIAVDRPKKKGAEKPETDFFNCTAYGTVPSLLMRSNPPIILLSDTDKRHGRYTSFRPS